MYESMSDFAIEQRELLTQSYRQVKKVVELNNQMCQKFKDQIRNEINRYFMENPRVWQNGDQTFNDTLAPLSRGLKNLHNPRVVENMVDPMKVIVLRARVVIRPRKRQKPKMQSVVWDC